MEIWGNSGGNGGACYREGVVHEEGHSQSKGPGAGIYLACSRSSRRPMWLEKWEQGGVREGEQGSCLGPGGAEAVSVETRGPDLPKVTRGSL